MASARFGEREDPLHSLQPSPEFQSHTHYIHHFRLTWWNIVDFFMYWYFCFFVTICVNQARLTRTVIEFEKSEVSLISPQWCICSCSSAPQMEICTQAIHNCFNMKIYKLQHDWVHFWYENILGKGQADVHTVVSYICDNEKFLLRHYSGLTTHFTWTTCFRLRIYLIICTLVLSPIVGLLDKMLKKRCQGFWQHI